MSPLPTRMHILDIEAPHRAIWKEVDMPVPAPGEVLVKVLGIATCPQWDLHMLEGRPMFPGAALNYPLVPGQPGHEAMGEVVSVGAGVRTFVPGMHVAAWRDPGNRRMGCYAQYVPLSSEDLIRIDSTLKAEEIASLELAMCVQGSISQLRERRGIEGKRLAISGLGPSGLVAVQLARAMGVGRVVGLDPLVQRRRLALELGADEVWDPGEYHWPAGRTQSDAFDSALDTTGFPGSIEALMGSTRESVAIFGVLREDVRFGPAQWWGGFALLGYATHTRAAAEEAYALITAGKLQLARLISARLPLSRYSEGVERLRRKEAIKILFDPWA
jgi:2-desacetyl-2-hydroxyethyl bacteriochlorophyllide A dehydrogenase